MWNYSGCVSHSKSHWAFIPSISTKLQNQHRNFCFGMPDGSIIVEQESNIHCHNHQATDKIYSSSSSSSSLYAAYSEHPSSSTIDEMAIKQCDIIEQNHGDIKRSKMQDIEKKTENSMRKTQKYSKRKLPDIEEMVEIKNKLDINILDTKMCCELHSESPNSLNSDDLEDIEETSPVSQVEYLSRERLCSCTESEDSFIVFEGESEREAELDVSDESKYESRSELDDYNDSSSEMGEPCKKVRFARKGDLCEIHLMIKWSYAYRSARKGHWEEYARDRDRFDRRIMKTGKILAPVLDLNHRRSVFSQRYENTICE